MTGEEASRRNSDDSAILGNSIRRLPSTVSQLVITQPNDFWIPQVTKDGLQVYFVNTQTGQRSRELPHDSDDISDDGLAGLTSSQPSSRAGTSAELGFASRLDTSSTDSLSRYRTETGNGAGNIPTGISAVLDQEKKSAEIFETNFQPPQISGRPRAQTDLNAPLANGIYSGPSKIRQRNEIRSVMDESKQPPAQYNPPSSGAQKHIRFRNTLNLDDLSEALPHQSLDQDQSQILEQALAQPPPDSIIDLYGHVRDAIATAMTCIRERGFPRTLVDEQRFQVLINEAISAIRNLFYVCGPPVANIPRHLIPSHARDSYSSFSGSHRGLAFAKLKASALLSKFVLSAQALTNDAHWAPTGITDDFDRDSRELEQSINDFMDQVHQYRESHESHLSKHLHGYFSLANLGTQAAGAGMAGVWKGFGWSTSHEIEGAPCRSFQADIFNGFKTLVVQLHANLNSLADDLRASKSSEVVIAQGHIVITELSSFVQFVSDINIARHVDIGQIKFGEGKVPNEQYLQSLDRSKMLLRTFEAAMQASFDDGSALRNTLQRVRRLEASEIWRGRDEAYDLLEALTASIKSNLLVVLQALEGLLSVGQEQTAIMQLNESHDSRVSQLSVVDGRFANILRSYTGEDGGIHRTDSVIGNGHRLAGVSTSESHISVPADSSLDTLVFPDESGEEEASASTSKEIGVVAEDDEDEDGAHFIRSPPRSHKIKAIFGDDAPQHYLNALNADTQPWYLRPNYNHDEILIDPDGTVRAGTVIALVERLTAHEYSDPKFNKAFLMTFKSFTNIGELIKLLIQRFGIQPPENLDPQQLDEWRKMKQKIIQMRVLNTFKSMVQDDNVIEHNDIDILGPVLEFVQRDEVSWMAAAQQLAAIIRRAKLGRGLQKITVNMDKKSPPSPIVPKRIDFLDIHPLELARQLTIKDSQLYALIRPAECLRRSRDQETEYNDNMANFIKRSNKVSRWVQYAILTKDETKKRTSVIKHFISVAEGCRTIQNFSAMLAIVSGLNSSPVRRLKRSWEQVGARHMTQLESCETTIDSYKNFNSYRSALAKVTPPCLPYVGVFLTALTHIQDGSKDLLSNNLINFRKRQKAAEVIQDLQRWQTKPHNFHPLPSVLVYIEESITQLDDRDAGDMLWNLSLSREPREKEEERLQRMLHESGFF